MKSFWATTKTELIQYFRFRDLGHPRSVIYQWLHLFYNLRRGHTPIQRTLPVEYEAAWFQRQRFDCIA
jgi:transposase InsO family protein